ncbi:TPA: toprim domain-containing protein [Legionella pneumophila]
MDINIVMREFKQAIQNKGLTPPNDIILDGLIHRFHVEGEKANSKNGWYFLDPVFYCGSFGSWRIGAKYSWSFSQRGERSSFSSKYKKHINDLLLKRQFLQKNAAKKAQFRWDSYLPVLTNHPYLIKKKISISRARQNRNCLVLPIVSCQGQVCSLQYINEKGEKRFLKDGAIYGNFVPIQGKYLDAETIIICEGGASGATLANEFPDACVIAACSAGNLKPVALNIRNYNQKAKIVIGADDDRLNPYNPGLTFAKEAAIACEGVLILPKWPKDAPCNLSDFNDLHCWLKEQGDQYE